MAKSDDEKGSIKNKKTCPNGHVFFKSSDCPVCPVCEQQRKPANGWMSVLSAPARRALENSGVATVLQLSKFNEKEILQLHGMGPGSIPKLRQALKKAGLLLKK
jgi:hypothetical protein